MRPATALSLFLTLFFLTSLYLANTEPMEWDEGAHLISGVFLADFFKWWVASPTFSFDKIVSFALDFNLHYKGAYLFFYTPLFHRFLVAPLFIAFGYTALTYRFVSVIISLFGLVGAFRLGKKLGLSEENSAFATVLLALIPIYLNQSHLAYNHIIASALIIWTAYFYISKNEKMFLLFSILSFHGRFTTAVLWAPVFIDTWLHDRANLMKRAKQLAVYLVFTAPWLLAMQFQPFFPNILTQNYGEILAPPTSLSAPLGYLVLLPLTVMPFLLVFFLFSLRKPSRDELFIVLFMLFTLVFYSLFNSSHGDRGFVFHYMLPLIVFIPILAELQLARTAAPRTINLALVAVSILFIFATYHTPLGWTLPLNADNEQIAWATINSADSGLVLSNPASRLVFHTLGSTAYLFEYPYDQSLDSLISGGWKNKYPGKTLPNLTFSLLLSDDWLEHQPHFDKPNKPIVFQRGTYVTYLLSPNG